jgi:uncharacterized protein YoxC
MHFLKHLPATTLAIFIVVMALGACTPNASANGSVTIQSSLPNLNVSISFEPQPTSFLGFYDTLFPATVIVKVLNIGDTLFPGGNFTLLVLPPSQSYSIFARGPLAPLSPSAAYSPLALTFQPHETGQYTVQFWMDTTQYGRLSLGNLTQDFRGPVSFIAPALAILIVWAVLASALVAFLSKLRTQRKRQETMEDRVNRFTKSLSETTRLIDEIQHEIALRQQTVSKLKKEEEITKGLSDLNNEQREAVTKAMEAVVQEQGRRSFIMTFLVDLALIIFGTLLGLILNLLLR